MAETYGFYGPDGGFESGAESLKVIDKEEGNHFIYLFYLAKSLWIYFLLIYFISKYNLKLSSIRSKLIF